MYFADIKKALRLGKDLFLRFKVQYIGTCR